MGFLGTITQYLSARLSLAGLEAKEAGAQYGGAACMIVGGLFVAVLGYVFLVMTAIFAIAAAFHGNNAWIVVMGITAVIHLAGAGALGYLGWRRIRVGAFFSTIEEFKKDKEWLNNLSNNR